MKRLVISTLLALAISTPALAQTSAEKSFSQGMEAFRSGSFELALTAFEKARKEGMTHPSLYYNMGVSAYRLARHEEARDNFLIAANYDKLRQVAHYNLGLVALKLGDRADAIAWFDRALEGDNDKIRALAATQLNQLTRTSIKNRYGVIGLSLGTDDNVVDPDATTNTDEGDEFVELFAAGSYLIGAPNNGWRLDASAYLLNYSQVDDFDISALRLGAARVIRLGHWRTEAAVSADRSTLGGVDYLGANTLELKGQRAMGKEGRLRLRYRFDSITALDSGFDYLQGQRHRTEVEGSRDFGKMTLRLAYEYEVNDLDNLDNGTTFSNYSPERHSVTLRSDLNMSPQWRLAGRLGYRASDYDEPNLLADGTSVSRSDEQLRFSLRAEGKLRGEWRLYAEYDHTENESNIDIFDYDRNILSGGVTWGF